MSDRVQIGATGSPIHTIEYGDGFGQFSEGWVVPASDPTRSAQASSKIDETVLNAFDASWSSSSLTVTIDPGEAFVDGWFARDTTTDVALASGTAGQTVYVGWDVSAAYSDTEHADRDEADQVIVGLGSSFESLDPKMALWTFDTDGSGVTSATDDRNVDSYRIPGEHIGGGEGSGLDADLFRGNAPTDLISPIYGPETDGSITRSSNVNENGIIESTTYTLQSGATATVSNGFLAIFATEKITIDGTIDANGQGGAGGAGGTSGGGAGGGKATWNSGEGGGGGGGTGGDASYDSGDPGGPGGGGGGGLGTETGIADSGGGAGSQTLTNTERDALRLYAASPAWDAVFTQTGIGGAGGGGGGSSSPNDTAGGDGGNGGGAVFLIAPEITGSGTITADGANGQDGQDGSSGDDGGGGGGGGGSGGAIALMSGRNKFSGTLSVTGGGGGLGGTAAGSGGDGGDGGAAPDGVIVSL
ncbi:hypothetical protein [Natrinema sp. H-ect4]|uniref:hypothetical protein n=1 Tax=Natrinema sp. H-ect4 TaxID=3242699 RepID=UPI0035A8FBC2